MNAAERFEVKPMKANSQETRIALLEQSQSYSHETLARIEKRFDKIDESFNKLDEKFTKIDERFLKIDERFERVYQKIDANNKWLIGVVVSVLFSAATISFKIYDLIHKIS